jgi:hypothetical protein
MKGKQLTLLIVICLVVGGLGLFLAKRKQEDWSADSRELGQRVLKDFSLTALNDVTQLRVRQGDSEVNLIKKGDDWVVQERGEYPANFNEVTDLLRKLFDLKAARPIQAGSSYLARFELLPPDKGTNTGTLLELKDKNGKTLTSLLLGKKHMKESAGSSQFGGGSFPDGRYVMVGNDAKTIALVSDALANVEPKAEQWLNKDFFKVEKPKAIAVVSTNATNNWTLTRETESGEWKLADAKPGEQLDTGKSSGVTSAFSFASFDDVSTNSSPEVTGLAKPMMGTLETFDGFTYTIKIGNKTADDKHFMQVAVAGNFPKERTAGKDEKAEDKDKLDKEFKEKTKKLEEKLKTDKAFEKWTYVVSKWTVDPLLKERKDLLQEKKEEPKKEEPKSDDKGAADKPSPFLKDILPTPEKK